MAVKTPPSHDPADGGCRVGSSRPRNGRIAFSSPATMKERSDGVAADGDIFTATPDGTDLRRVTHTLDAVSPAWSPDGRRLAYIRTAWRLPVPELWVIRADGFGARRITRLGFGDVAPAWSPDGKRIAFGDSRGISLVEVQTGQVHRLPWLVRGWDPPGDGPRWSADGQHLAVVSPAKGPGPDEYTRKLGLFTIDSSTGGDAARVLGAKDLLGHDWSWTNCRMVYASGLDTRNGECNGDLYVTDADLRDPTPLPAQKCRQSFPVWSPDGQALAYDSAGAIWIANADGTNAHQAIAPLPAPASVSQSTGFPVSDPDWQPLP